MDEFIEFKKIPRLSREIVVTEKIDGTNAQIMITEDGRVLAGSRHKWITPDDDNFGFAKWVEINKEELLNLGVGRHFGEWWGPGINRGYGVKERQFSLFNVERWGNVRPSCCSIVPVIYRGPFLTEAIEFHLIELREKGSVVSPGFMRPEGIVIFHKAGNLFFKKTIEKDEEWKGKKGAQ